ncbi:MAG: hypothetical protein JXA64_01480 [Candidatus Fermentibacteraceae bacterium]|nr:hypothetical protein [Candidatus Fermentibacteraceae bacterium]MBN2607758.1 hypothetical protein [Candidatus Fermentibacteraceae bacterium]
MGIRVWVEPERRLVRIEIVGDSSTAEIIDAIDSAVSDPRTEPGFNILSDHTGVGEPLTTPQAHEMADHFHKLIDIMSGSRWAVVSRKAASIGMMRMLAVLLNNIPMTVEIFDSIEEAEEWLFSPDAPEVPEP